ncbi:MAG TPA: hypothetical protein PKN04_10885 [bacterium]|nr:hypothetical protein [bacterium]HNT66274.1 hypothetical protein [bacterium]HOX86810.1 hypothetical protein [bacterium]HPG46965.1 hypothetical protein [bacterium]HPM99267.1 hypothetical protein [bacterium]
MKKCPYHHLLQEGILCELQKGEAARLKAHLQACAVCRTEWDAQQQLRQRLAQRPKTRADAEELRLLREAVLAQLPSPGRKRSSQFFPFLAPSPAWQYAFALFLLVFGFLLGQQFSPSKAAITRSNLDALLTASQEIQAQNSTINPFFAGVNRIRLNPETGQIDIHYNTIADIALSGSTENSNVHLLLQKALVESEDSSVRLNALEAVQLVALEENGLNQDLIAALERLLFQEDNPGIRLLVLKIFEVLPLTETVREALTRLVQQEKNSALRIKAFDILTQNTANAMQNRELLQSTQSDSNTYIQYRSNKLLRANSI